MAPQTRIAVIGAGSLSHGKRLIDDLLGLPVLEGGSLNLMGNNARRLEVVGRYACRMGQERMPSLEIRDTTDRREALDGADIVFSLFDAGGFQAFDQDWNILAAAGLEACIGDTAGPLGIMRALRNGSVMLGLAEDMNIACPGALLVNYVNPMAPLVAAAAARGIGAVGVCGGIEATRAFVASVLGLEPGHLRTVFAGINHLCWLLSLEGPEGDLYPAFKEAMANQAGQDGEAVRFELLQQFGHFASESSGHLSDFFPWFRRTPELLTRYCASPGYTGASGAFHRFSAFVQRHLGDSDYLEGEVAQAGASEDYGPRIAEAWLGGGHFSFTGNVLNQRPGAPGKALPALPDTACVELPLRIEGRSLVVPEGPGLPPALAALCLPMVAEQGLILEALLNEDPELAFAAAATDPLTASVLDLPDIRRLMSKLLEANAPWLAPDLGRRLRETRIVSSLPKVAKWREKEDPLLALVRRFERRKRGR